MYKVLVLAQHHQEHEELKELLFQITALEIEMDTECKDHVEIEIQLTPELTLTHKYLNLEIVSDIRRAYQRRLDKLEAVLKEAEAHLREM